MKRYTLLIIIIAVTLHYAIQEERPRAVPTEQVDSELAHQDKKDSPNNDPDLQDAPPLELGESGYCGARLPPNFQPPSLTDLLNAASGPMGNQARALYRRQRDLDDHLTMWQLKDPSSPYPHVWKAFLKLKTRNGLDALPDLEAAQEHLPDNPALALIRARLLAHTSDLTTAIEMLKLYLVRYPEDAPNQQKLARLQTQNEIQSRYATMEYNGLTLLYPPETEDLDWLGFIHWLDDQLEAAAAFSGTIKRETLTIIAFEGKAELLATTCTPIWTGGVYDGSIKLAMRQLESLPPAQTAAHETLHAQLSHSLRRNIPAWFSEGMAQAFAQESRFAKGTWRKMVQHETYIPFSSLGDSFLEFKGSDDARLAYHQGLAMVLWLESQEGEAGIHRLVRLLQQQQTTHDDLIREIQKDYDGSDFLEFVSSLL